MTAKGPHRWRWAIGWITVVGGFLGWFFYIPGQPEKVFRAVPDDVSFICSNPHPASEWNSLSTHPLFRNVCQELGLSGETLDDTNADPNFQAWLRRLASDRVVLFQTDSWRTGRAVPFWGAASWLGNRSHRLRWFLKIGRLRGFKTTGEYQGRQLWAWRDKSWPEGMAIHLAFEEGILIACYSDDPSDLIRLLSVYDGTRPCFDPSRLPSGAADREHTAGLMVWPARMQFTLHEANPQALAGDLRSEETLPEISPLGEVSSGPEEALADVLLRCSPGLIRTWAASAPNQEATRDLLTALEPLLQSPVTLGLYGGHRSGRIYGMKVPTLILSVPVQNAEEVLACAHHALDILNARYRASLIASEQTVGEGRLFILEATAGGPYAGLAENERAGFLLWRGRFWLSTQADKLRELAAGEWVSNGTKLSPVEGESRAVLSVRVDLEQGGPALRSALAVFTLQAAMSGSLDAAWKHRLRMAREILQRVEDLGRVNGALIQKENELRMEFIATAPASESES